MNEFQQQREQLSEQYSAAVRGRSEAEIGVRLKTNRPAARFSVLETALVPDYPVAPSRKKLAVFGLAGLLAVAGGVALLIGLLKPVLRTSRQMRRHLDIGPVTAIPRLVTMCEVFQQRLSAATAFVTLAVGILLAV